MATETREVAGWKGERFDSSRPEVDRDTEALDASYSGGTVTEPTVGDDSGPGRAGRPEARQRLRSSFPARLAAKAIASDVDLALTLLSYVAKEERVEVRTLLEQGPRDRVFGLVFDLYDAGLLGREEGAVMATRDAKRMLERMNLLV